MEGEGAINPALQKFIHDDQESNYRSAGLEYRMGITLNNCTYLFFENPDDGYRSYLDEQIVVLPTVKLRNHFPGIEVIFEQHDESRGLTGFVIRGKLTNKEILRVGTDDAEDYYPTAVGNFDAEVLNLELLQNLPKAKAKVTAKTRL